MACRAYSRRVDPYDPVHAEHKKLRNHYGNMIDKAKKDHWGHFLQNLDEKTVWTAHRYASSEPSDGGRTQIPTLKVKTQNGGTHKVILGEEKGRLFEKTFFLDMATT